MSDGSTPQQNSIAGELHPSSALATMALACSAFFLPAVVIAAMLHPAIPIPVIVLIAALPLAGLILGIIAVRSKGGSSKRHRARAAMIIGGIELGLVVGAGVLLPSLCRSSEPANRGKCASNLREVGLGLFMYANSHGDKFPSGLDALLTDPAADLTSDLLICPSSSDDRASNGTPAEQAQEVRNGRHLSYIYVAAGLTAATITPAHVLVYEPTHNHNDKGMNVLYGDQHVNFLEAEAAARMTAELGAGHNPPKLIP